MKNHLKRLAAPKSWVLDRHVRKYIIKPSPGAHSLNLGLALGFILRDLLHIGSRMDEVKKILATTDILVDGVARHDHRFMVGLFDVVSIPNSGKHYRVTFDYKGRLTIVEVPASEASMKVARIVGKSVISGGKVQFHLHDGRNVLSDVKASLGDSLVITFPKLAIKEVLPLKKDAFVFLWAGKRAGEVGVVDELISNQAVYTVKDMDEKNNKDKNDNKDKNEQNENNNRKVTTAKRYLFVVGSNGKSVCTVVPK